MKAIEIESQRLTLKPLTKKFASRDYVDWLNDPKVYRYLETKGGYTLEALNHFLESVESRDIYFWAIIKKSGQKHIGNIKIDPIDARNGVGEYGILLGDKDEWGNGFAKEASEVVINFCFEQVGLRKITLGVVKENIGALNLYIKMGFKKEGLYLRHAYHDDKWCDVIRMALFKSNLVE